MARKTGQGTLMYVSLEGIIKYVFASKLKESLRSDFGQTRVTKAFNVTGAILGANSPSPTKASKKFPDGYEGSYCSNAQISALRKKRYRITRPKLRVPSASNLSKAVYVTINGVKYAWQMSLPNAEQGSFEELSGPIGITPVDLSADNADLVWGASFPKPARATFVKTEANGDVIATFSSFCDDSKHGDPALTDAGWEFSDGVYTQTEFNNLLQALGAE